MSERTEREIAGAERGAHRFDGETVRRILERAAQEQHRLNMALADSYSLGELQEMAAEARISPEALRAAIESDRAPPGDRTRAGDAGRAGAGDAGRAGAGDAGRAGAGDAGRGDAGDAGRGDAGDAGRVGSRSVLASFARWIPGRTPAAQRMVLTSTGGVAFIGLLLAFPAFAEALFWAVLLSLLVLSVLVLLGASPF